VAAILHKQASGLVHGMLAASLAVTPCESPRGLGQKVTGQSLTEIPVAVMSRPVAGVRGKTVVVTLPGSPKGAKENLQAIIKMLPHACLQAAGADSRTLHSGGVKKLEAEAGVAPKETTSTHSQHHHHHHHHHGGCHGHGQLVRHTVANPMSNDPNLGPTRRYRESPYPMISVEDALSLIKKYTPEPEVQVSKVGPDLVGSFLAEDIVAKENVPAFRASIVDGYAVVVPKDGRMRGVYPVVAVSHAAPGEAKPLNEGEVARITTGAPLPLGATSVIMVEDTVLKSTTEDGKEEKEVEILADHVKEGENIREVGSDVRAGDRILAKGDKILAGGGELGVLASVGTAEVKTYRKPVIAVLSTGDEIVEHNRPGDLRLGEVRDTNRITLISAARSWGFEVLDMGIAKDRSANLETTLRDGLRSADVIITTGGVSMGELDLLKPTIERALGGNIRFGRVNMKPGKPTTFATVPVKDNEGRACKKSIFSLPGNPASALVTFHLFVLPSLHQMAGDPFPGLPRVSVKVAGQPIRLDAARPEYHRALVQVSKQGLLCARSTGGQRSSRVGSLHQANALLCLPAGKGSLESESTVDALLFGPVWRL
jgi:gephyrin